VAGMLTAARSQVKSAVKNALDKDSSQRIFFPSVFDLSDTRHDATASPVLCTQQRRQEV
jgi:hypothetical protein